MPMPIRGDDHTCGPSLSPHNYSTLRKHLPEKKCVTTIFLAQVEMHSEVFMKCGHSLSPHNYSTLRREHLLERNLYCKHTFLLQVRMHSEVFAHLKLGEIVRVEHCQLG